MSYIHTLCWVLSQQKVVENAVVPVQAGTITIHRHAWRQAEETNSTYTSFSFCTSTLKSKPQLKSAFPCESVCVWAFDEACQCWRIRKRHEKAIPCGENRCKSSCMLFSNVRLGPHTGWVRAIETLGFQQNIIELESCEV